MSAHATSLPGARPVDWRWYAATILASVALIISGYQQTLPLPFALPQPSFIEVFAFVAGAWAVWLAAKNHILSWPIGILNAALFVILFYQARLFFDSAINVYYVVSGIYGLWFWMFGGANQGERPVFKAPKRELVYVGIAVVLSAIAMAIIGPHIRDAFTNGDAITTALSIGAQWLLMRRFIENWYLWIAADIIYVPLYWTQNLHLTAVLYVVFMAMCFVGLSEWRSIRARQAEYVQ